MPPFEDCVTQGHASCIMCSYNAVNGVPSCANDWLLQHKLRGEWQFDGYITSDCDADSDVFYSHHYTPTPEEAVADVLRAGTDVDCGSFVPKFAQSALDKGAMNETDVDAALHHLMLMKIRLGYFDPLPSPLATIGPDQVCSAYARELARDAARQGSVLLKNDGQALPLTNGVSVAAIGPNVDLSSTLALCVTSISRIPDALIC